MNAVQTTPQATSSTLYFGPWYRRSPFFERTLDAGCSAYDIYNHMYLPGYYADPIEEYWALLNDVTVWDVSVERIVEITGRDATAFTNSLTCRDLTTCAVGQGKYMIVTAEDGGIVNDPVLLRVEADRWWLALADSDAGLWARGVAINSGLDVKVREPEVYPIQVQGPKSKDTMRAVFGPAIDDIKYYWTLTTEVDGIPVVISRTGWTGEVGYEVYLRDPSRGGDLWDRIMEAGKPHKIRPIAPCEARRIEAGIFNYGSDMTIADTPFHVMGLERLVETQEADYIGKAALEEIRVTGVDRKLVGIEVVEGDPLSFEIASKRPALHEGEAVGTVTDLIWSPRLERNIGYVWVPIELAAPGTPLEIVSQDGEHWPARTAAIPFLDPKKAIPLG
jgi:aminomethyltransferase